MKHLRYIPDYFSSLVTWVIMQLINHSLFIILYISLLYFHLYIKIYPHILILSFFPPSLCYLPPALRFCGAVYWCPGRFPVCAFLFPASGLFSLCPAAPPSSPTPPPSLPSSRARQHQPCAQDQPTFLGRRTSRLLLALLRCCCPSGCEEMGQCLTAEEGDSGWELVHSVSFTGKYCKVLLLWCLNIPFRYCFLKMHIPASDSQHHVDCMPM